MNNVINLATFRKPKAIVEQQPGPDDLATMSYDAVLAWSYGDFDRLVAVVDARNYRPEWVLHQMDRDLTPREAEIIARMVADAGPYLSPRRRWIVRQVKQGIRDEGELIRMAKTVAPFRECRNIATCVRNDLRALIGAGLIQQLAEAEGELATAL